MAEEYRYSAQDIAVNSQHLLKENPGFSNDAHLSCITCNATYPTDKPLYNCADPACGDILDVSYQFPSDLDPKRLKDLWKLRRTSQLPYDRSGVWRFRELLPFVKNPVHVITMEEGNTPILAMPECAEYVGLSNLVAKHQGFNPTGSFKDPGMATAITQAVILGMRAVASSSTGNTSASESAYAKRAGLRAVVLIPEGQISYGKLSQSLDYGALTIQIGGDFDRAMELIMKVAPELGIYVVNSINPFRIEGQKTMIIELLEQLDWQVPDRIVVPGGNLGHAASIWKGLKELKELGFIDRYPRLTIVQASGANPFYRTITSDNPDHLITVHARTLATAIKIGNPISWKKAKRGLEETDGWIAQVTEQEIADAKAVVGRDGVGCEPASAVTIAGLKKIVKQGTDSPFDRNENVVVILTGHLLKDPSYTLWYHRDRLQVGFATEEVVTSHGRRIKGNFANQPIFVEPDEDKLRKILQERL